MSASKPDATSGRGPGGCLRVQLVALAVLGGLVAIFEVGLRLVDVPGFTTAELDPIAVELADARIEPHPYLAYANKPGWRSRPAARHAIAHNALGFRGPETTWEKPAGTYRIVCLGGSSTYGHGPSSNAATWPARLQAHLTEALGDAGPAIEVVNGGCQGYSTFESLINLELRMIDLRPDLVLVYHTINDARCALYPGVRRDNAHWRAIWPVERVPELQRMLERSRLFHVWRRYFTDYVRERQDLGAYLIVDFGRYEDAFAQPDPGDLGFRSFQRNLVSIVELARAHGAAVALITQGLDAGDLDGARSKALQVAAFDRMTAILHEVAAERGAALVDARPVLEGADAALRAADGADRIFTHEVHLQDEGADLLARTVAAAILERIPR